MNFASTAMFWKARQWGWSLPLWVGLTGIGYQLFLGAARTQQLWTDPEFMADIVLFGFVIPLLVFRGTRSFCQASAIATEAVRRADRGEQLLAAVGDLAHDAIVVLDRRGRIVRWNNRAQSLFGRTSTEVSGRPLAHVFDEMGGIGRHWRHYRHLLSRRDTARPVLLRLHRRDFAERVIEASGRELIDRRGRVSGLLVVFRDLGERVQPTDSAEHTELRLPDRVTALARARDELQRIERTRAETMSLVAHELRLPLTNIRAATDRLQAGCDQPESHCARLVHVMQMQLRRLDALLRDLLDVARMECGAWTLCREFVDIQSIVRDAVILCGRPGERRPVEVSGGDDGLIIVDADRERLLQVLGNLLSNAAKYSPHDSAIAVEIDSHAGSDWVTLRVRDHGHGVPDDCLERVFDKFFRAGGADAGGTEGHGLGLFICRQIVAAHGGRIWAENHPAGGAVFGFTLPIAR